MINFDKLNEMINGVNRVLVDVDMETLKNNEQVYFNKAIAYEIATEDLRKYCEILDRAVGNPENNHKIGEFKINLGFVELKFTTYSRHHRRGKFSLYINEDVHYDGYEIICRGTVVSYEAINHSFDSVIQFEKMCQEWGKHKAVVETAIVNRVNEMLKYRTEIAHENLDKSKEALRNTPRLDFD